MKVQPKSPATIMDSLGPQPLEQIWAIWPADDKDPMTGRHPDHGCLFPFGGVGDRLWVRERFSAYYKSSVPCSPSHATYAVFPDGAQSYKAGGYHPGAHDGGKALEEYAPGAFDDIRWRPSIHMPRWASRITLEITEVRAQRLQEISEADVYAEGIVMSPPHLGITPAGEPIESERIDWDPWMYFQELWESINGIGSWDANPWVWAITFRRIPQPDGRAV